ncbi:MAG: alpha/beta hydrolase [Acidobacteriota bacterium]|nr:alpha/beta hydrolase [Acidobacteriota bacterium]
MNGISRLRSGGGLSIIFRTLILFVLFGDAAAAFAQSESAASGMAEVGGGRLYYEIAGKGRTVVFIHGGLADSRVWDDQFKKFSKHFRVLRYDLRGFNRSDSATASFSHVDDLHALLKFLKIERASLVGLSLGGIIAADFALEHPEMVEKLVLSASGLRGDKAPRSAQSIAVYKAAEEKGMKTAIEMWMRHPFFAADGGTDSKFRRRSERMLADNYKYWGPTPEPIPLRWSKYLTIDRLSEIKAPALVVIGDRDLPELIAISDTLAAKIGGAKKEIIKGVSHHLNMEKPREYNRIVLEFLK